MTKREARKAALRLCAAALRTIQVPDVRGVLGANDPTITERSMRQVVANVRRISDHLQWEADGRPDRT
jgi:hypothetical protein